MKRVFNKELQSGLHLSLNDKRLRRLCTESNIGQNDKDAIIQIFRFLFDNSKTNVDTKSIRQPGNFDLYFDNALNTKGILFKDFTPVLQKPWNEIETHVQQWISEGKEGYLIDLLHDMNAFESRDRFERITYIWITLVNHRIRTDHLLEGWIRSISENRESINRFYGVDKTFFERIFQPNPNPFFYDTYPIRILLRKYIDDKNDFFFPLSKDELQQIALSRLRNYIGSRSQFDVRVFNNFYYNIWQDKDDHDRVIILDEANRLAKEYIEKYPEDYLRFTIRSKYTPHLDEHYVFEPFTKQYFGSWEEFKSFLAKTVAKTSEFSEMVRYFEAFEKANYDGFQSVSIPQWIEMDSNGNSSMKYFKDQTYEEFVQKMKELRR